MILNLSKKRKLRKKQDEKVKDKKTIIDEEHVIGSVPFSVYLKYFNYNGVCTFICILLLFVIIQVVYLAIPFWLTIWSTADDQEESMYFYVLAALAVGLMLGTWFRNTLFQFFLLNNNRESHDDMLDKICRSAVTFFDANPAGRILNRFTKDAMVMDNMLKFCLVDTFAMGFLVAGNFIVMMIINPYLVPVVAILLTMICLLYRWTIPTVREVRRTELITKSPIFNNYASSLSGVVTIRAYGLRDWLLEKMHKDVIVNLRGLFTFNALLRTYMIYVDLCATTTIAINAAIIIALKENYSSEIAGLSLSFVANFAITIAWFVKVVVEAGNHMTST